MKELGNVIDEDYLKSFFNQIQNKKDSVLNILYKDYPSYNYSYNYLIRNQNYIKGRIHGIFENIDTELISDSLNNYSIKIKNNQKFPLLIKSIIINDENKQINDSLLIHGESKLTIRLKKYHNINKNFNLKQVFINFKIPYFENEIVINKNVYIPNDNKNISFHYTPKVNTNKFYGYNKVIIDEEAKKIEFPDNLVINEIMVIPPNYKLICNPGTSIDIKSGGGIVSFSPIIFNGEKGNPIIINANHSNSNGILVLETISDTSIVTNTNFNKFSNLSSKGWGLTGSITFYKSPVRFEKCNFSNNTNTDDYLNIIKTTFSINDCFFDSSFADALDADFCIGNINNTIFKSIGNDALDFSGSNIKMYNVNIVGAGDKAISAGEGTIIYGKNVTVDSSEIAFSSKDDSFININNVRISNSKVGYCAYNKKSEYGSGTINIINSNLINVKVPFLIENKSYVIIDNKTVEFERNSNVKDILYGIQYGKKS